MVKKVRTKTEYQSVQIPKTLIDEIKAQIPQFWYRSHHEFIIDCIRSGLRRLIKTKYSIKQLKIEVNNKENKKRG